MAKNKKRKSKAVDYRCVNLDWLVDFKDRVFAKELAPEIKLVVSLLEVRGRSNFEIHSGDTLCVTGETATTYSVTRPYGDMRTGEVAKLAVAPKPREEWSTEDVAEYVIKRACLADQCSYLELVDTPKKNVSKKYKGVFVSQAHSCRFADLVSALQHLHGPKNAENADQFVWLDIFSANQPKLAVLENAGQLIEDLLIAIAKFEKHVMFIDKWDDAVPLRRAWCVWEIFCVAQAKKPLEIALPRSEYNRFVVTLKEDYNSIIRKAYAVDVKQAQCFNPVDLKVIHDAIRDRSSFKTVDDIIKTRLSLWVATTGKLQVEEEEQKANPELNEISLLAYQAGLTYQELGDFDNAELLQRKALRVAEELSENRENDRVVAVRLNSLAQVLEAQVRLVGNLDETC